MRSNNKLALSASASLIALYLLLNVSLLKQMMCFARQEILVSKRTSTQVLT